MNKFKTIFVTLLTIFGLTLWGDHVNFTVETKNLSATCGNYTPLMNVEWPKNGDSVNFYSDERCLGDYGISFSNRTAQVRQNGYTKNWGEDEPFNGFYDNTNKADYEARFLYHMNINVNGNKHLIRARHALRTNESEPDTLEIAYELKNLSGRTINDAYMGVTYNFFSLNWKDYSYIFESLGGLGFNYIVNSTIVGEAHYDQNNQTVWFGTKEDTGWWYYDNTEDDLSGFYCGIVLDLGKAHTVSFRNNWDWYTNAPSSLYKSGDKVKDSDLKYPNSDWIYPSIFISTKDTRFLNNERIYMRVKMVFAYTSDELLNKLGRLYAGSKQAAPDNIKTTFNNINLPPNSTNNGGGGCVVKRPLTKLEKRAADRIPMLRDYYKKISSDGVVSEYPLPHIPNR